MGRNSSTKYGITATNDNAVWSVSPPRALWRSDLSLYPSADRRRRCNGAWCNYSVPVQQYLIGIIILLNTINTHI